MLTSETNHLARRTLRNKLIISCDVFQVILFYIYSINVAVICCRKGTDSVGVHNVFSHRGDFIVIAMSWIKLNIIETILIN